MHREHPISRMTLRELLTHVEKSCRHLAEQLQHTLLTQLTEFSDLSRPVRRRSHYPTLGSFQTSLKNLDDADAETKALAETVYQELQAARDRAMREKVNRL